MRNILVTVMMIIVVVVLFMGIINSDTGIKSSIEEQGNKAITQIENVSVKAIEP